MTGVDREAQSPSQEAKPSTATGQPTASTSPVRLTVGPQRSLPLSPLPDSPIIKYMLPAFLNAPGIVRQPLKNGAARRSSDTCHIGRADMTDGLQNNVTRRTLSRSHPHAPVNALIVYIPVTTSPDRSRFSTIPCASPSAEYSVSLAATSLAKKRKACAVEA